MSRKITEKIVYAFMTEKNFKLSNSEVKNDGVLTKLYLFNNKIAVKENSTGKVKITLAGYPTNTTRERLNGLPNCRIIQKDFTQYLNGEKINSYDWYAIN